MFPGSLRSVITGLTLLAYPVLAQVVPDRYIVELKSDLASSSSAKSARRAAVLASQAATRQAVRALDGEVISSIQTVANALVVRIPDKRAGELADLPGVARVYPVREVRMELDQALPLHRIPDAWRQIGGAAGAGAGVKIGFIDSGIETDHPGFSDTTLAAPEGFPKTGSKLDEGALNSKIIVVRNYESMIDPTIAPDPKDHNGHGTAVAMAAAGMPVSGPYGDLSGVAQKAYIGVYKVFSGANGGTTEDVVLKALDDAVDDGMDIVNISLGVEPTQRPSDDVFVGAVEEAAARGVIVVKSAGNSGPTPNTLTSPAAAPSGLAVGAQWNQRNFADPAASVGDRSYPAVAGSGPNSKSPIEAQLVDVAGLDTTGRACGTLAEESLLGKIAFILRGECLFEDKLNNARRAGAAAALLYSDPERPDAVIMSVGSASLPAVMVSHAAGLEIKERLAANPALTARLRFELEAVPVDPLRLAPFSSRGPTPEYLVKPDLVAAGVSLTTAAQSIDSDGDLYSGTKYLILNGTSFSAPLVAGAAAVLKSARPGLTAAQYRSLLVNSAAPLASDAAGQNPVQQAGAGMLNLDNAVRNTIAVEPVSISFGAGEPSLRRTRDLNIANLAGEAADLTVTVEPSVAGPAPVLSENQFNLAPGASKRITIDWNAGAAVPGEYQGVLRIRGARSGVETRVPYWFAAPSNQPRYLRVIPSTRGTATLLYIRAVDPSGIAISGIQPTISVVSGPGSVTGVVQSVDSLYPGYWTVRVQLSAQTPTVFRIDFGDYSQQVSLQRDS